MSVHEARMTLTAYPHIIKADGISGSEAIIKGTRLAVWNIVGYYQLGMSVEDILADWDYLTPAK